METIQQANGVDIDAYQLHMPSFSSFFSLTLLHNILTAFNSYEL
jgi:hypothetical protein